MTAVARSFSSRHYGAHYETDAVGPESASISRATHSIFSPAAALTKSQDKAALSVDVTGARAASAGRPESGSISRAVTSCASPASAVTTGHDKALLFADVAAARAAAAKENWDNEGAEPIDESAIDQAIQLVYALPGHLPPPTIAPESTGEITFEWYRDNRNVAVLSVDGKVIRWSSVHDGLAGGSGSAPFAKSLPAPAMLAISKVLDRTV